MIPTINTAFFAANLNDFARFAPYAGALAGTLILGFAVFRIWKKTKIFKNVFSLTIIFTLLFFGIVTFLAYRAESLIGFTNVYLIMVALSLIAGIIYTVVLNRKDVAWSIEDGHGD